MSTVKEELLVVLMGCTFFAISNIFFASDKNFVIVFSVAAALLGINTLLNASKVNQLNKEKRGVQTILYSLALFFLVDLFLVLSFFVRKDEIAPAWESYIFYILTGIVALVSFYGYFKFIFF